MNKTIYMTYKKPVPNIVYSRWTALNKDYRIDFSPDADCISFLKTNFNDYVADLFINIPQGMYKADLWRLCKLYINGGVYADVDLVPYINIDKLDKNITFYSCLAYDSRSIFQAFMVNFSKPRNPLILQFLMSFLLNNPYTYDNGPTFDMYNCISYNLNGISISPNTKYDFNQVKILVNIGRSDSNTKRIDLHYFPNNIMYTIKLKSNPHNDNFNFYIENNFLIVTRVDANCGWGYDHSVDICIQSNESVFLFKEKCVNVNRIGSYYVSFRNKRILNCRDLHYLKNGGW